MKSILLIIVLLFSIGTSAAMMEASLVEDATLAKPAEGKVMVYFARRDGSAFLIKFSIYDGDLFLGKLGANKYFAYECDPGKHVFMAKSENTSYVEADLEAGKTYVMDTKVRMGVMTAQVKLSPLDRSNKKYEKEKTKFLKFINKKDGELITEEGSTVSPDEDDDSPDGDDDVINDVPGNAGEVDGVKQSKRMMKFYRMKEKGKKITTITPDMYFN